VPIYCIARSRRTAAARWRATYSIGSASPRHARREADRLGVAARSARRALSPAWSTIMAGGHGPPAKVYANVRTAFFSASSFSAPSLHVVRRGPGTIGDGSGMHHERMMDEVQRGVADPEPSEREPTRYTIASTSSCRHRCQQSVTERAAALCPCRPGRRQYRLMPCTATRARQGQGARLRSSCAHSDPSSAGCKRGRRGRHPRVTSAPVTEPRSARGCARAHRPALGGFHAKRALLDYAAG